MTNKYENLESYYPWVQRVTNSVVRRYQLSTEAAEGLVSEAYIGLIHAYERFDTSQETNFKQYAYPRVRGAIIDAIRKQSILTRCAYRNLKEFEQSQESDCAKAKLRNGGYGLLAYRAEYNEEQFEDKCASCEDKLYKKELLQILVDLIAKLPDLQRKIIVEHYFKEKRFSDIVAEDPDLSKSWTSKLHARAIKTLSQLFKEDYNYQVAA